MEASSLKNSVTTLNAHLHLFSYRGQFGVCEPQLATQKWLKQGYWDVSDKQCAVTTFNDYQRLRSPVYKCFLPNKSEYFIYIIRCVFILRASEGWVEHALSISLSHDCICILVQTPSPPPFAFVSSCPALAIAWIHIYHPSLDCMCLMEKNWVLFIFVQSQCKINDD